MNDFGKLVEGRLSKSAQTPTDSQIIQARMSEIISGIREGEGGSTGINLKGLKMKPQTTATAIQFAGRKRVNTMPTTKVKVGELDASRIEELATKRIGEKLAQLLVPMEGTKGATFKELVVGKLQKTATTAPDGAGAFDHLLAQRIQKVASVLTSKPAPSEGMEKTAVVATPVVTPAPVAELTFEQKLAAKVHEIYSAPEEEPAMDEEVYIKTAEWAPMVNEGGTREYKNPDITLIKDDWTSFNIHAEIPRINRSKTYEPKPDDLKGIVKFRCNHDNLTDGEYLMLLKEVGSVVALEITKVESIPAPTTEATAGAVEPVSAPAPTEGTSA